MKPSNDFWALLGFALLAVGVGSCHMMEKYGEVMLVRARAEAAKVQQIEKQ